MYLSIPQMGMRAWRGPIGSKKDWNPLGKISNPVVPCLMLKGFHGSMASLPTLLPATYISFETAFNPFMQHFLADVSQLWHHQHLGGLWCNSAFPLIVSHNCLQGFLPSFRNSHDTRGQVPVTSWKSQGRVHDPSTLASFVSLKIQPL